MKALSKEQIPNSFVTDIEFSRGRQIGNSTIYAIGHDKETGEVIILLTKDNKQL